MRRFGGFAHSLLGDEFVDRFFLLGVNALEPTFVGLLVGLLQALDVATGIGRRSFIALIETASITGPIRSAKQEDEPEDDE